MAGSILRGGVNYSNHGFNTSAFDIGFSADINTGLASNNVNDALNELAYIVRNVAEQFSVHSFTLGADAKASLKEALLTCSRAIGGQRGFELRDSNDVIKYIGVTLTSNTSCSFMLHSVADRSKIYYGAFDNLDSTSFEMYPFAGGSECFSDPSFVL